MTVTPAAIERIAERLGCPASEVAYLAVLDEAQLERLDTAVAMAQHHEDAEVHRSMRDAVRLVPAPLRRRVHAALFPDEPDEHEEKPGA